MGLGNHVTLPTRQQDAVVEVPGRECQGQGDSSQQEHVYEEVAEPLPRPPFCFRSTQGYTSAVPRGCEVGGVRVKWGGEEGGGGQCLGEGGAAAGA